MAQGEARDDWVAPVRSFLLQKCFHTEERLTAFQDLLRATGAVISGGSILRAIDTHLHPDANANGWTRTMQHFDLDIYVPLRHHRALLIGLYGAERQENEAAAQGRSGLFTDSEYLSHYHASYYCRSFMRQNGIRSVQTRMITLRGQPDDRPDRAPFSIDVMSIRNRRSVQEVVSHFDLTFCQIWFDGAQVFATHPDHILRKAGSLQPDYHEAFLDKNRFILHRLEKYVARGYTIETPIAEERERVRVRCHKRPYHEVIPHTVRRVILNMICLVDFVTHLCCLSYSGGRL
jgi:hypothetical protein